MPAGDQSGLLMADVKDWDWTVLPLTRHTIMDEKFTGEGSMTKPNKNVFLYLLMPEDSAGAGDDCLQPMVLKAGKAILWLCLSVLAGLGLDRLF